MEALNNIFRSKCCNDDTFTILSNKWDKSTSDTIYKTYKRPTWSGDVLMEYDSKEIWRVSGIVIPVSTTGRPDAPKPYNGRKTGGTTGLDKGHVMALSLGGPDMTQNIVPQSNLWQQSGYWRDFEKSIENYAAYKYRWKKIVNAKDVRSKKWKDPKSCDGENVFFSIKIDSYYKTTGEPKLYEGFMECGCERFDFTIKSGGKAKWKPDPFSSSSIKPNVVPSPSPPSSSTTSI